VFDNGNPKDRLPRHGSYYTLYKRQRVKRLAPKFPLFLPPFSLDQANCGTLCTNPIFWRQNAPFSFQHMAFSLENKALSGENMPFFSNKEK
jgi:hypothetical protein